MKHLQTKLAALSLALIPGFALAGTDYSDLVEAVDFATVSTGVLGVAAALITVYITIKGVKLMMGFVRGG